MVSVNLVSETFVNLYKVRTYNQIALRGLERFPRTDFEVGGEMPDPHAILLRSHVLGSDDLTSGLRAVARAGAGVNNVPVEVCSGRGVVVFNTPGANANSVKELVLAALLLSSRDVLGGLAFTRALKSASLGEMHAEVEGGKKRFKGQELHGKSLGVVGLGAIGSLVAAAGLNLGMKVLGYDPSISVDAAWRLPSDVQRMENLPALLSRADFVTLHVPLLDETRGFINQDALKSIKPGAALLNFARQEIVDETALKAALADGRVRCFFSDFPSPPLIDCANAYFMPHLGASTAEAEENCAVMAADQLVDFLVNGNIRNSVNFPTVLLERSGGVRMAVTNRNVPRMLGQVLSLLAESNLNVVDMINKSREAVAYNLIDLAERPSEATLAAIGAIDGVVNVHVFDA